MEKIAVSMYADRERRCKENGTWKTDKKISE